MSSGVNGHSKDILTGAKTSLNVSCPSIKHPNDGQGSQKYTKLLKPFPKHYSHKKNSIFKSITAIVNPDSLEAYCICAQTAGAVLKWPVTQSSPSNHFQHKVFELSNSKTQFLRGVPSKDPTNI